MSWTFVPVNGPYGGTTEGPVWDGECLLFTHIPDSAILKFDPKTGISTTYLEHIDLDSTFVGTLVASVSLCLDEKRRKGDIPILICNSDKARKRLLWSAKQSNLYNIIRDEIKWINSYHEKVFVKLKKFMNKPYLIDLKQACSKI